MYTHGLPKEVVDHINKHQTYNRTYARIIGVSVTRDNERDDASNVVIKLCSECDVNDYWYVYYVFHKGQYLSGSTKTDEDDVSQEEIVDEILTLSYSVLQLAINIHTSGSIEEKTINIDRLEKIGEELMGNGVDVVERLFGKGAVPV